MANIKCPRCGEEISLKQTDYESVAKQVRDEEFNREISQIEKRYEEDKNREVEFVKKQLTYENEKELQNQKDNYEAKLKIKEEEIAYYKDFKAK